MFLEGHCVPDGVETYAVDQFRADARRFHARIMPQGARAASRPKERPRLLGVLSLRTRDEDFGTVREAGCSAERPLGFERDSVTPC